MKAHLDIQTTWKNGRTCLQDVFYTPPLKIADITESRADKVLQLMLMSSSPGILDGDHYSMKIEVGEKCSLELQTQSYQRLYTMKTSAFQEINIHVQPGGSFCFVPHPVVPHHSSNFSGRNKIFLSPGSNFIWGEVLTCGRKLNGEVFQFSRYHTITEIFLSGRLVIRENLFLCPGMIDVDQIGQMEGFSHQATLICVNENLPITALIKHVREMLASQPGNIFGITSTPGSGFIVRLLGQKAEKLFDCLKTIAGIVNRQSSVVSRES